MSPIKNISEVTEPLKDLLLQGNVHTIDEMKAWRSDAKSPKQLLKELFGL